MEHGLNTIFKGYIGKGSIEERKSGKSGNVFWTCTLVLPNSFVSESWLKTAIDSFKFKNDPEMVKALGKINGHFDDHDITCASYYLLKHYENFNKLPDAETIEEKMLELLQQKQGQKLSVKGNFFINAKFFKKSLIGQINKYCKSNNSDSSGLIGLFHGNLTKMEYENDGTKNEMMSFVIHDVEKYVSKKPKEEENSDDSKVEQ